MEREKEKKYTPIERERKKERRLLPLLLAMM